MVLECRCCAFIISPALALQAPVADGKQEAPQTVYTVRMCTGGDRGSGMTELRAGVWLGLVSKDGAAFLHRATPLSDPEVIEQELIEICQVHSLSAHLAFQGSLLAVL